MLMHTGMLLANVSANLTGKGASLQLALYQVPGGLCLARKQTAGRLAHIRAIQVEANALNQFADVRLSQAGICAGSTGLGAIKAGLNTGSKRRRVGRALNRVGS
jgi:hypothetical protein